MNIFKTAVGETHEIIVSGRIDGEGANKLEIELLAEISAGAKEITVDLEEATFICSAGLRTLLQYWRQMKNKGHTLQVVSPSAEVMTVLSTSGFKDLLIRRA
jgi:anti-anti-sigma factor